MLNIFVLGLDEPNSARLQELPEAADYRFHQLLTIDELRHGEQIPIRELLDKATAQLEMFDGHIDAVVGYWDFPVTQMVPILCRRFGLRSPTLEAVLKCEHKYWSRLVQREVIPDEVPRFDLIELDATRLPDHLSYPVWVKPVKSTSSESAYYVDNDDRLREVLSAEREEVGRIGRPFEYIMSLADVPEHISDVGGQACLVEEQETGYQVTVEGHSYRGDVKVCGVIDSFHYPDSPSFLRYQYPSKLPEDVLDRLTDVSRRVMSHIGLDDSTYNIEYFWDPERSDIKLLEINPRHSQSHAMLYQLVDGLPNHKCMVDLALGKKPDLPHREGDFAIAAKWFPRRFEDGVVRRRPSDDEIAAIEADVPGTTIEVIVEEGLRLSDMHDQDSYSFGLANIHIGADSEEELADKYERCIKALPFEFSRT